MEHVLCETHAYNRALIVNVFKKYTNNGGLIGSHLLYKTHAYTPVLIVSLQCLIPNSKQ